MGIGFDPWQDGAGKLILAKRADGFYAATVGGVVVSIPRQVGKTFLIGAIVIALCILFPGTTVLWTAHRTRTSTRTFQAMQALVKRKKIKPHLKPSRNDGIRTSNGEQEIEFQNGSVILFGAREQGFGRGFEQVDIEVFDEAQILTEKALEDMVAATNQAQHPHGALLFYIGTPPRPVDPGEAFTSKRLRAIKGLSSDMLYIEFSADEDADLDDQAQWAKANPSFPKRTPLQSMLRLRENLPGDDSWRREALGIWPEDLLGQAFGPGRWEACSGHAEQPDEVGAIGLEVAPDREWSSIAGAGLLNGKSLVGSVDRRAGTGWLVPEAKRIQDEHGCRVVVATNGQAADLIPALEAAGVKVTKCKPAEVYNSCSQLYDAVREQRLGHGGHSELDTAVAAAIQKRSGKRWLWVPRQEDGEISMLWAATFALWGLSAPDDDDKPLPPPDIF